MFREISIAVRWSDLDGLGHVNNACYLTYCEEARTDLFKHLTGTAQLDNFNFILARAEIDFVKALSWGDVVHVKYWVSKIGTRSFDLTYELSSDGAVVANSSSVQVFYDYGAGTTMAIPPAARQALQELMAGHGG